MANASLSPIYERLNGVQQYHPFSAKTFADWASEAGDTVQISREGTSYSVPVHKQSLVWRGKHMINMESTGSKERTPIERMSNRKENETSAGMSAARGYGGGAGRKIDHLLYEIDNPETGLAMRLEANEEFADLIYTKSGLDELGQSETLMTRIHQNAESISLEARRASLAEGVLQGKITVEADRITQEVSRASLAEGVLNGKITVEAGKITQIVSNIGYDGTVTAASICLAINNGGSSATINADKIYLLGQTITNTITADYIGGKIASLANVNVQSLTSARGGVNVYSVGTTSFSQGGVSCYVPHGIWALQITQSGNTYTLQRQRFSDDGWVDVGTFSRATTLSGDWSGSYQDGKRYKVDASPQGVTKYSPYVNSVAKYGSPSWSAGNVTYDQKILVQDSDGNSIYLGTVDVKSIYDEGKSAGQSSGYDSGWNACRTAMLNSAERLDYYTGTVTTKYDAPVGGATARQVIYPYAYHQTTTYTVPDRR